MSTISTLPIVMTKSGLTPQAPAALRARLVALVEASNPGYTANLPGSLIEDIASTDTGALVLMDQFEVELVNCLTPYGANAFLLNQLGQVYGVQQGLGTNTSVEVVFTGTPGYLIPVGFTVSDGTHQYTVQRGAVIAAGGTTSPVFCLATTPGVWSVPNGTVTGIATSLPPNVTLTVTNPADGTPSAGPQTLEAYRADVLQAGIAISQGMTTYMKTLLRNVTGVQPRLVSAIQQPGGWEVIVGGGDSYEVANAIFEALFDISSLVGSTMSVLSISNANPGVMTTTLNHGYTTGEQVQMNGATGMTSLNGVFLTVTVIDEKSFSIGVSTSSLPLYTGGGVLTPNLRNEAPGLNDYPNTYTVPIVRPPQQTVAISLTWNSISTNFISPAAIAQLGTAALVDYVNSVPVGQPMNLFELQNAFQTAVAGIVPPQKLTRMVFAVSINGIGVAPTSGTGIIAGDPESFFETANSLITITQG